MRNKSARAVAVFADWLHGCLKQIAADEAWGIAACSSQPDRRLVPVSRLTPIDWEFVFAERGWPSLMKFGLTPGGACRNISQT